MLAPTMGNHSIIKLSKHSRWWRRGQMDVVCGDIGQKTASSFVLDATILKLLSSLQIVFEVKNKQIFPYC